MKLDIKSVNDLYFERYIETKKMIDRFHEIIENGDLEAMPDKIDKIGLYILKDFIADSYHKGTSPKDGVSS